MIADYFMVRRRDAQVDDLYRAQRRYEYSRRIQLRALFALAGGIAFALIGLVVPALRWLYDYAWFVGFFAGIRTRYFALMSLTGEKCMALTETRIASAGFLIAGKWESPQRDLHVVNPASGEVIAQVPYATVAMLTAPSKPRITLSSNGARFRWWTACRCFIASRICLEKAFRRTRHPHARERQDARRRPHAEVRRAIQMVEVACGMPSLMMGDSLNDVAKGIDCAQHSPAARRLRRHHAVQFSRHGADVDVSVRHRLRQHVRLKPSEKVPLTPTRACELLVDAGLKPASSICCTAAGNRRRAAAASAGAAVSFVGSTPVAKYIYTTAAAEGKRVQALGGAKNHLVVMPDANIEKPSKRS
jgi:malonate-semialdehyde dehydrogenase (acetylating) / methylmalonate-semialdehyde dehydrogenase